MNKLLVFRSQYQIGQFYKELLYRNVSKFFGRTDLTEEAMLKLNLKMKFAPTIETREVIVEVDEDMCINCGRYYMACNNSGYQAIMFDESAHITTVTGKGIGCAFCLSICPFIDFIHLISRDKLMPIIRGDHFELPTIEQ